RVIDGDTIVVRTRDEREETVRYIGINAPEIDWESDDRRGPGWAARTLNQRLVAGQVVRLELDAEPRDSHGRLLAYVYAGDVFVNARLVEEGWAVTVRIPPNDRHFHLLLDRQRAALAAGRGFWGEAAAQLVDWQAAGEYIGLPATVEGVVRRVHRDRQSGIIFLNFGPNPRRDFTVVIRPPFGELFLSPEERYLNRRVRVRGIVGAFQGQQQIVVQLPEQIEVISSSGGWQGPGPGSDRGRHRGALRHLRRAGFPGRPGRPPPDGREHGQHHRREDNAGLEPRPGTHRQRPGPDPHEAVAGPL